MHRKATIAAALLACAGVALGIAAVANWPRPHTLASSDTRPPKLDLVPPISAGLGAGVKVRSSALDAQEELVRPASIEVPALDIDMPVAPMGLNAQGGLALADTSLEAAWYRHGGMPGELNEATLIAAHVDNATTGIGPFARLRAVEPGTRVAVALSNGSSVEYTVVGAEQVAKDGLDFGQVLDDSPGMLVLVTCGGRFDANTGHYEDNVIVWAVPTDSPWSRR